MKILWILILAFLIITLKAESSCQSIQCADMILSDNNGTMIGESCLKSFNGASPIMTTCNTYEKEYCHMTALTPLTGECKSNATRFEFYPVEVALPGERWDPQRALYECGYGYRSCSAFRCLGFLENERCAKHADCNPGLYWDKTLGICKIIKELDNQCQDSEDCGRTAACIYLSSTDANGKWIEYYTVADGFSVYAKREEDTFVCEAGYASLTTISGESEYLIGNNFVEGIYECGKAIISEKAGSSCETSFDWYSSEGNIFAKWDCSAGSSQKIWGILQGNNEWKNYFKSVKSYYKSTKNCHGAQNFEGVCGEESLNNEKQCNKAMAKNYVHYVDAPEWVKLYSNKYLYPEVSEVEEWCNSARK